MHNLFICKFHPLDISVSRKNEMKHHRMKLVKFIRSSEGSVKFLYGCSSQENSRLNYMILVQLEPIFECWIHPNNNVLKDK